MRHLNGMGGYFAFTLRGKGEHNAFIDMGDQFINMTLVEGPARQDVERRHIGLVVDERSRVIELAQAAGARMVEGPFLDFLDPWGNRLEIIEYSNIQFTKAPHVLRGMGLALDKNEKAKRELADKGMIGGTDAMKFSLIVRGQHPPGDHGTTSARRSGTGAVRGACSGSTGIVKGSHYSAHPFEAVQQIPFLSYCAAIAPRLRIICGLVLVPLHKPLDLAEQLATLDLLCGGKLVFGAGIGYRDVEFKAFGVPRGKLGARFEECLTAIRRLWTEEFVSMKGSDFELDHATCTVKPLQKPTPPIWIGANADVPDPTRGAHRRLLGISTRTTRWRRSSGRWIWTSARSRNMAGRSLPRCRCAARCLSLRPALRRSDSHSLIWRKRTRLTVPGVRTR